MSYKYFQQFKQPPKMSREELLILIDLVLDLHFEYGLDSKQ